MTARKTIGHLVRRFFGHLRARALGPEEQQFVHDRLSGPCAELFWMQSKADQRHGFDVARRVETALYDDDEAIEAALLHDIGKRRPSIGPVTRSIATILHLARAPMTKRMAAYRDHGKRGAADIEEAGCGRLAVEFARRHPASAPPGYESSRWQVLLEADR